MQLGASRRAAGRHPGRRVSPLVGALGGGRVGGQRGAHFSRGKSLTLGKRTIMKCSERKLHSTYGGSRWSTIRRCGPCLGFRRNSCTALGCARPAGTTASLSDAPACERARNSWRRGSSSA